MKARLHSWLVQRYPREFRSRFAESMNRDFADLLSENRGTARPLLDTAIGAVRENVMTTRPLTERPLVVALLAALFAVPLLVMNHIVVFRIEPVFSWIRPGAQTGPYEWAILWFLLALILVGAIFALLPLLRARTNRWWLLPDVLVAVVLLTGFVLLAIALGHDMTCDAMVSTTCD